MLKAASSTRLFYWRKQVRGFAIFLVAIFLVIDCAKAESEPATEFDTSGRGAILCLHSLLAATASFARVCREDGKVEIERLHTAIKRIEKFEVKHGKWSIYKAKIFSLRAISKAFPGDVEEMCTSISRNNLALFESVYAGYGGPDSKNLVDNALSVARKPVMTPCFLKFQ
jgi:hypothetical protein